MLDWLPIDLASSAMAAERMRMNALASNLANVNSTRTPEGGPYKPLAVTFQAEAPQSFQSILDRESATYLDEGLTAEDVSMLERNVRGVKATVRQSGAAPELRYEPNHPDADPATGMVAYPSISPIEQMTNMMAASRIYEANAASIKMTKEMLEEVVSALRG